MPEIPVRENLAVITAPGDQCAGGGGGRQRRAV